MSVIEIFRHTAPERRMCHAGPGVLPGNSGMGREEGLRQEVKIPMDELFHRQFPMRHPVLGSKARAVGRRSSLFTAGFTLMWNDARSNPSFGPITPVNLSTVVLKFLACICCNSIVIVMSNNPLSRCALC